MKTNLIWRADDGELRYDTDHGIFTKKITHRGYSVHIYSVRKIHGSWPSNEELLSFCDNRTGYFGGSVVKGEDTAMVECFID